MSRALITSGGGAKGSFSIGALRHLILDRNLSFDIVSGTSTGSYIAALYVADKLTELTNQYLNVQPDDILNKQNIVNNILTGKPFLFSTTPLNKLIQLHITLDVFDRIMDPASPVLCITAVSLQTGKPTIFSNRDLIATPHYDVRKFSNRNEMIDALLASGSQAGFTPPVPINGEQFVDGGHRDLIPSRIVVDLQPDEIFVLSNGPTKNVPVNTQYTDVIQTIFRVISIFLQDVRDNDMAILFDYCRTNNKNLFIIDAPFDLDEENPTGLGFNPLRMANWMMLGENRAKDRLTRGPEIPLVV
jgi:predicted acylesterase/phospholipase RssA